MPLETIDRDAPPSGPDAPVTQSADWEKIDSFTGGVTIYKSTNLSFKDQLITINLAGDYVILTLNEDEIVLSNPEIVNPDWNNLIEETVYASPSLSTNGIVWVGPFDVNLQNGENSVIIVNIVCAQGLYGTNKKGDQYARTETVLVEITPIAKDGTELGSTETFTASLTGSNSDKKQVAITINCVPSFQGRAKIRLRRTSPTNVDQKQQSVDDLKWESCYGLQPVTLANFGDVTTVFTRTYATQSALNVKERRFNCLATRKIPLWSGTSFGALTAQTDAAAIISAIWLDPKIGSRQLSDLNATQIYAETEKLRDYFGFNEASDFSYTFDDDNISAEETISTVAQSVFSSAYRIGSVLHLYGEIDTAPNNIERLLFNHRNMIPKSESRTVTFGKYNDYDGVELTYVSPDTDTEVAIYIPDDQSAIKPNKIETIGIRNESQATIIANRAYNKILYQNTATQFEGLEEAEFLLNNNRIFVADTTRRDSIQGYIKQQVGLILELSQPFNPVVSTDYSIFIQHIDGTVQNIDIEPGADQWHVVLAEAPSAALSLGDNQSVVASYWIVGQDDPGSSSFIITEIEVAGKNTFSITAINYDARYYANDQDFA